MEQRTAFGVNGADYKKLFGLAKRGRRIGYIANHKSGRLRFYVANGQLYCQKRGDKGELITQDVINIDTLPQRPPVTTDVIRAALQQNHPELGAEELDAHADIIKESHETMSRLMTAGLTQQQAEILVKEALENGIFTPGKDISGGSE
jgi:hypothetical protein